MVGGGGGGGGGRGGGGGGCGGGAVGACYTDYGAFQDLYHILEYKNRIQYKVSF